MPPRASTEGAGQIGFEENGNSARQTDLSAMSMPAQHQVETRMRSLTEDLRRMREQDRHTASWNVRRCFFDVVGAVVMRVIHPGEVERSRPALDQCAFVKQHANAKHL